MKFSLRLKVLFICLVFVNFANSQVRMPFSPDVMAFKKYSDYPVSEYTGVASIGFPILDMDGITINLRYHSSGVKVDQEASSVGLGWNLQAGGVITQDIRGYDDFDTRYPFPSSNDVFWQLNAVNAGSHYDRENLPEEVNRAHPYIPYAGFDYTVKNYYTAVVEGLVQPDIYNYSLGGYDGKFVINPVTKEVLLFDRSHNIKFEFTYNTLNLTSFTAITPDGTKYYFDNVKQSYESVQHADNVQPYISHSFYLNTIIMTDGQQINFDYNAPQGTFSNPYGNIIGKEVEVKTLGPNIAITDSNAAIIEGFSSQVTTSGGFNPFTVYNKYTTSTQYNKVTLKSIISDKIKVYFDSSPRLDYMDEDKIDQIRIEDHSGNTINKFHFSYSYFNDSATYYTNQDRYDNLRLKLNSVTEVGKPPYQFNYYENTLLNHSSLPSKKSYRFDFWGYYNGKNNDSGLVDPKQMLFYDAKYFDKDDDFETSLDTSPLFWTPTTPSFLGIYYTASTMGGGTADKIASEEHNKVGILEEITYPEGGKTKFTYENNTFSNRIYPSEDDIVGEHIVDENFYKKYVFFEVRDTVGIRIKTDFSMGDKPVNWEKIMDSNKTYVKIYSFATDKPIENLSVVDNKTLIISKGWTWKESIPNYTTETLTDYISYSEDYYKFYPGKYMIEVELSDECGTQGSATNHAYVSSQILYAKRKVRIRGQDFSSMIGKGGGLRIKEIDNYDIDNKLISFQKYTYDEGNKTYGKLILPILFKTHTTGKALEILNFKHGSGGILDCSAQDKALDINKKLALAGYPNMQQFVPSCTTTTSTGDAYIYSNGYLLGGLHIYGFDSNPIPDMSTFGYEYCVGYDKVKIEKSSDGGGFTNKYFINNVAKANGQLLKVPAIPNTLNGSVTKIEQINYNKELVKKDEYEYESFDKKYLRGCFAIDTYAGPQDFRNLNLSNLYVYNNPAPGTISQKIMAGRYHMYYYPINSSLDVISKHKETFYFKQGDPIVKERNYLHNSIGQLTKETVTESNLLVSSIEYQYPFDSNNHADLTTRNFLTPPIRVTSKRGNTILKEEKFYYGTLNNKGPLLNYKTTSIEGQSDLITDNYFYSIYTDQYNNSIAKVNEQFQSYGNGINPMYNIPNTVKGPKSKYIYGYNYKYIVAKIEGLDAISTESFISEPSIQLLTGTTLENNLNQNLRNNSQVLALNLMVTTYTYDPVTGQLLSTTDPKGLTTNYTYDSLHRLKHITDHNGKVIKSINYHYKQ